MQWSTPATAEQSGNWHLLTDAASALAFADEVAAPSRPPLGYHTGIGTAINHSAWLIENNAFQGRERKIDVSGDGRNNALPEPEGARARAVARDITINGLAVPTARAPIPLWRRLAAVAETASAETAGDGDRAD